MKHFAYPMRGTMVALKTIILTVFCLVLAAPALAQRTFDVQLWQKKAPNNNSLGDTAYVKVYLPDDQWVDPDPARDHPNQNFEELLRNSDKT